MGRAYNMYGEEIEIHQKCRCLVGPKQEGEPPKDGNQIWAKFSWSEQAVIVRWDSDIQSYEGTQGCWMEESRHYWHYDPDWWAPINWEAINGKDGG
ncbi:hypothetical protein Pla110_44150 [Polystyrenella longa]|uniref:Uncharacterized protein n=1 Tax=Polystyrenella longa TaxID=2528007 RepID=A0A518CTZ4_9PLAN|nr:hypothetical protein [Polystyrenella longa]QDU82654.1 hypothetical protein Pla110_44150 [Polystyrenella longa]